MFLLFLFHIAKTIYSGLTPMHTGKILFSLKWGIQDIDQIVLKFIDL